MEQIKVFDDQFKTLIGDTVQCVYFENIQTGNKDQLPKTKL